MALLVYQEPPKTRRVNKIWWILLGVSILVIIGSYVLLQQYLTKTAVESSPEQQSLADLPMQNQFVDLIESTDTSKPKIEIVFTDFADDLTGTAFRYPQNWQVNLSNGLALAKADPCGKEGVLFYPFVIKNLSLNAQTIAKKFIEAINAVIPDQWSLADSTLSKPGKFEALIQGILCQTHINGRIEVLIENNIGLIKLGWSNHRDLEYRNALFETVFKSWQKSNGVSFTTHSAAITMLTPPDYTVQHHDQSIEATNGTNLFVGAWIDNTSDTLAEAIDAFITLETTGGRNFGEMTQIDYDEIAIELNAVTWQSGVRETTSIIDGKNYRNVLTATTNADIAPKTLITWRRAEANSWYQTLDLIMIESNLNIPATSSLNPFDYDIYPLISKPLGNQGNIFETLEWQKTSYQYFNEFWVTNLYNK